MGLKDVFNAALVETSLPIAQAQNNDQKGILHRALTHITQETAMPIQVGGKVITAAMLPFEDQLRIMSDGGPSRADGLIAQAAAALKSGLNELSQPIAGPTAIVYQKVKGPDGKVYDVPYQIPADQMPNPAVQALTTELGNQAAIIAHRVATTPTWYLDKRAAKKLKEQKLAEVAETAAIEASLAAQARISDVQAQVGARIALGATDAPTYQAGLGEIQQAAEFEFPWDPRVKARKQKEASQAKREERVEAVKTAAKVAGTVAKKVANKLPRRNK